MASLWVSIKIRKGTWHLLKIMAALRDESVSALLDRLVKTEAAERGVREVELSTE